MFERFLESFEQKKEIVSSSRDNHIDIMFHYFSILGIYCFLKIVIIPCIQNYLLIDVQHSNEIYICFWNTNNFLIVSFHNILTLAFYR